MEYKIQTKLWASKKCGGGKWNSSRIWNESWTKPIKSNEKI